MKMKLCSILLAILLLCSSSTLAVSVTNNEEPISSLEKEGSIVEMIQQIDESLVFYYHDNLMKYGFRYTGTINCTLAAQYIYDEFEDMGLDVNFHEWKYDRFISRNVVATLPGSQILQAMPFLSSVPIMIALQDLLEQMTMDQELRQSLQLQKFLVNIHLIIPFVLLHFLVKRLEHMEALPTPETHIIMEITLWQSLMLI